MTLRAAIYARYSSDLQSEASIEDQIRLCREWIDAQKHTVQEVFTDYAISGGAMRNRPGIQALLNGARYAEACHARSSCSSLGPSSPS